MQKRRIDRKEYISFLSKQNSCLLGPQGIGKTTLLKQLKGVYIDCSRLSISPENFAVEYVGSITHAAEKAPAKDYERYLDIDFLLKHVSGKGTKALLLAIENELLKIKPNQRLLIASAFAFPESLSKEKGKLHIKLDNFEELLALNNYSQIDDLISLFLEEIKKHTTRYSLASSSTFLLKKHLKMQMKELLPFTEKETDELAKAYGINDKKLHQLTEGIPFLVEEVCKRYQETKNLEKAFIKELLDRKSASYNLLKQQYSDSLNRARGATLLKNILKVLSRNPPMRLTHIAKKIYRSSPVTKSLLERLMEVDLVKKDEKLFTFISPVLRLWCKMYFLNITEEEAKDEL